MNRNPIPIVLPCHRIVGANGSLTGYARRPRHEAPPARARGRDAAARLAPAVSFSGGDEMGLGPGRAGRSRRRGGARRRLDREGPHRPGDHARRRLHLSRRDAASAEARVAGRLPRRRPDASRRRSRWATFPPSGGSHYRLWATWGFYRKAVNPRMVVHNEEHGGVVIWWGPGVPQSTVDQLEALLPLSSRSAVFGTPIAGLGSKIALTAWNGRPGAGRASRAFAYKNGYYGIGRIAICTRVRRERVRGLPGRLPRQEPAGVPDRGRPPGLRPRRRTC